MADRRELDAPQNRRAMAVRVRKFGAPLYCCAWIGSASDEEVQTLVVGGGGGKGAHGIKNRLVVAQYRRKEGLTDEVSSCSTGERTPQRMAVHPNGKDIIVSMEDGCVLYHAFGRDSNGRGNDEVRVQPAEERSTSLSSLPKDIKCMKFSANGDKLVLGCEDGSVFLYTWPDLQAVLQETGERALRDSVTGIDLDDDGDVLLATSYDGNCYIWNIKEEKIFQLRSHKAEKSSFRGCALSSDGKQVFVGRNSKGDAYVSRFAMKTWEMEKDVPVMKGQAITSFECSPDRTHLVLGGSEGEVAVVKASPLRVQNRTKKMHMVFVTAASFSRTGDMALTVSADASAVCTSKTSKRSPGAFLILSLLVLLVAILAYHVGDVSLIGLGTQIERESQYKNE